MIRWFEMSVWSSLEWYTKHSLLNQGCTHIYFTMKPINLSTWQINQKFPFIYIGQGLHILFLLYLSYIVSPARYMLILFFLNLKLGEEYQMVLQILPSFHTSQAITAALTIMLCSTSVSNQEIPQVINKSYFPPLKFCELQHFFYSCIFLSWPHCLI